MADKIVIEGLQLDAVIGVYTFEQKYEQRLCLDLELFLDARQSAETDNLEYTLDYAAISQRLRSYASDNQFQLIETMAERLAALLIDDFSVSGLRLKLSKPGAVAEAANVAVVIERGDKQE